MNKKILSVGAGVLAMAAVSNAALGADSKRNRAAPKAQAMSMGASTAAEMVADWPERPRLAALQMIGKYGQPQQVTAEKLTWDKPGPFKRITIVKQETPHDFPMPHMDFMQHTVEYRVPADKADKITEFDGSATFNRTDGELSGKCDLEGHNILTLNLANDIATGKKSVKEARKAYGEAVVDDVMGKNPPYIMSLQFTPASGSGPDPDKPTIPGAPMRAPMGDSLSMTGRSNMISSTGDAEVLALLIATNLNQISAAAEAEQKKVGPEVMAYAKMLHQEHGKNLGETMKLGEKIKVTPLVTAGVDQLHVKGAGELAMLVPKNGDEFGRAYIDAMVKGHQEVIETIDQKLLTMAQNAQLKQHLTMTRGHIVQHLDEAKRIQSGMGR